MCGLKLCLLLSKLCGPSNLVSMVDICRCIVSNAELSDATFATFDLSLRYGHGHHSSASHTSTEQLHHHGFNSLMTGAAALAATRSGGVVDEFLRRDHKRCHGVFHLVAESLACEHKRVVLTKGQSTSHGVKRSSHGRCSCSPCRQSCA